jgi:hypothetical protein
MAYFSNSSEGSALDELCTKCVHLGSDNGPNCPVLLLQLLWNYDQFEATAEEKAKKQALDMLIPQKDGEVKCSMFHPLPEVRP